MKKKILIYLLIFLFFNGLAYSYEIEEIIVKANKVEENAQDIKGSITVFDETIAQDLRIETLGDIAQFTPNFMLYNTGFSGMNSPSIRGMHADHHSHTVSAGLYVDGVPFLDAMGEFAQDLVDIESISVLKGPQGTLYGKAGQTGIINITTKKPGNIPTGRVTMENGSDNKLKTMINFSGPISKDKVYLGLSSVMLKKDGYVENAVTGDIVDDTKHFTGRGKLRFTPTEKLDVNFSFSHLKYDDGAPHIGLSPIGAKKFKSPYHNSEKVESDLEGYNKSQIQTGSLSIEYDEILPNTDLTMITSFTFQDTNWKMDQDFSQAVKRHIHNQSGHKKQSQEIRLSSSEKSRFKWVAGLYGDIDDYDNEFSITSAKGINESANDLESWSYSFFSDLNIPIGEKLGVSIGMRYDFQEMDYEDVSKSYNDNWNEISPKIGVDYNFNKNIMAYGKISKGYSCGGFNHYTDSDAKISYEEEKLISYEIGAKQSFFNKKLILNFALFYMDIDDLQVAQFAEDLSNRYTSNAGEASAKGVEIEFTAKPTKTITLFGGFGSTDIEFDKYEDLTGNYEGNKKPFAPEYTFNAGVKYRNIKGFYGCLNLVGYGEMYTDRENQDKTDAYVLLNFKTGLEFKNFDFYFYGSNILDEEYNSTYNHAFVSYSKPSEFGVSATLRF